MDKNKTGLSWTCQTDFNLSTCVQPSDLVVFFFFQCVRMDGDAVW